MTAYDLTRIRHDLITSAGGYLRNPIRQAGLTCAVCTTPTHTDVVRCDRCTADIRTYGTKLADAVAPIIYAVGGSQAAFVMRAYKAPRPQPGQVRLVSYLTWFGILQHSDCAGRLAAAPVTHWATVPSYPGKPGVHPLHRIVAAVPPARNEVSIIATSPASLSGDPRATSPGRFTAGKLPHGSHVLLIDDTWASGGHGQSAALTMRHAGAARVSLMVVARWINRGYGANDHFIRAHLTATFDPGSVHGAAARARNPVIAQHSRSR